jgi:hypothetical protein
MDKDDTTSSFPVQPDLRRVEIIESKPVPSGSFKVLVDGRSVSGSARVDLKQIVISGVRIPNLPSSCDGPTSSS